VLAFGGADGLYLVSFDSGDSKRRFHEPNLSRIVTRLTSRSLSLCRKSGGEGS
jgi:hypothetical protein